MKKSNFKFIKCVSVALSMSIIISNCNNTIKTKNVYEKNTKYFDNINKYFSNANKKLKKSIPYILALYATKLNGVNGNQEIFNQLDNNITYSGAYSIAESDNKLFVSENNNTLNNSFVLSSILDKNGNYEKVDNILSYDSSLTHVTNLNLTDDNILNLGYLSNGNTKNIVLWEQDKQGIMIKSVKINKGNCQEIPTCMTLMNNNEVLVSGHTTRHNNKTNAFFFKYTPSQFFPVKEISGYSIIEAKNSETKINTLLNSQDPFKGFYIAGSIKSNNQDILFGELNNYLNIQRLQKSGGIFNEVGNTLTEKNDNTVLIGGYSTGSSHKDMLIDVFNKFGTHNKTIVIGGHNQDDEIFDIKYKNNQLIVCGYIVSTSNKKNGYISSLNSDLTNFNWEKHSIEASTISTIFPSQDNCTYAWINYDNRGALVKMDSENNILDCLNKDFSKYTNSHITDISPYMHQENVDFNVIKPEIQTINNVLYTSPSDFVNKPKKSCEDLPLTTTTSVNVSMMPLNTTLNNDNVISSNSNKPNLGWNIVHDFLSLAGIILIIGGMILGIIITFTLVGIYKYFKHRKIIKQKYQNMDNEVEMNNIEDSHGEEDSKNNEDINTRLLNDKKIVDGNITTEDMDLNESHNTNIHPIDNNNNNNNTNSNDQQENSFNSDKEEQKNNDDIVENTVDTEINVENGRIFTKEEANMNEN